jgi:bisphosphoglycerate-dependent phosphoglycerate mutase
LVLLRHGQSEWNAKNVFTGWANPDLTEAGERDAVRAGHLLGEQQVQLWRRSYAVAPPPATGAERTQAADPRYAAVPPEARPQAESLRDVTARLLPYWYDSIVPGLRPGTTVLIVSHGNTLRALVKHLDAISDEEIAAVEIAPASRSSTNWPPACGPCPRAATWPTRADGDNGSRGRPLAGTHRSRRLAV